MFLIVGNSLALVSYLDYFQDLQELFSLPKQGFDISVTQQQLLEQHGQQQMMYVFVFLKSD